MAEMKTKRKLSIAEGQKKLDAQREKDHELLTGIFRFIEHPRGTLEFRYGSPYKGDAYKHYMLTDGMRYKLPRMVVRHLNNEIAYRSYKKLEGEGGDFGMHAGFNDGSVKTAAHMMEIKKVHRCEFVPLDFMNDENDVMPSKIVEVQATL